MEKQLFNKSNTQSKVSVMVNTLPEISNDIVEEKEVIISNHDDAIKHFYEKIKTSGLHTKYGIITDIKQSGQQGGNGKILFGSLNKHEVAIKVLYNSGKDKDNRFKNEFINVFMSLQKFSNIVEMYLYDSYFIDGNEINYIVMKKYNGNLEKNKPDVTMDNLIMLMFDLLEMMNMIHEKGIIHRDIKPSNILIDTDGNRVLSDFGIANFDPELYENTGHTIAQKYLGNRKFSAPEQSEPNAVPAVTMDIFAFGEVLQWFAMGRTHSGSGRKELITKFDDYRAKIIDAIIDKSMKFSPEDRYQSSEEILNELKKYEIVKKAEKDEEKKIESFFSEHNNEYKPGLDYGEKITII